MKKEGIKQGRPESVWKQITAKPRRRHVSEALGYWELRAHLNLSPPISLTPSSRPFRRSLARSPDRSIDSHVSNGGFHNKVSPKTMAWMTNRAGHACTQRHGVRTHRSLPKAHVTCFTETKKSSSNSFTEAGWRIFFPSG